MADTLIEIPGPINFDTGKPRFPIEGIGLERKGIGLKNFIGERSWLFFDRLHADGQWHSTR